MARSMAAARSSSAGSSAKKANSNSRRSSSASSRVPLAAPAAAPQQPSRRPVAARAAGDDSGSAKVENPFRYRREPSSFEAAAASLSKTAATAAAGAALLGAAAAGGLAGRAVAPPQAKAAAAAVGAAAGAAAAAGGVKAAEAARVRGAGALLANRLVDMEDPARLTRDEVAALEEATGVDFNKRLVDELKAAYDTFLSSAIPAGELVGGEADRVAAFKDALGLLDEDAAPVHMDVGRRLMRARFEAGTRAGDARARQQLAKLIYLSSLIFGEQKAAFMLPWRRAFDLTDAQLYVAKRDCAKQLFRAAIAKGGDSNGKGLAATAEAMRALEQARADARLAADAAAGEVRAAARAGLEARLAPVVAAVKDGGVAGRAAAVAGLKEALAYGRALARLASSSEASSSSSSSSAAASAADSSVAGSAPPGLAIPSIQGGALEKDPAATRALRDAYGWFLDAVLDKEPAAFDAAARADADDLALELALSAKEAGDRVDAAVRKAYRRALRAEVTSGRLDAAPSKAAVLGELCERLSFDAADAAAMHVEIYKQKADALVAKGSLTDQDAADLDRLRVLLCVQRDDVAKVARETAGKKYAAAVAAALAAGVDAFSPQDEAAVAEARKAVRLDPEVARSILSDQARKAFLSSISKSRSARSREAQGQELRSMVIFSNVVVAPLLRDLRSAEEVEAEEKEENMEKAKKEIAELMAKAKKDADAEERAEKGEKEEGEEEGEKKEEEAEASSPSSSSSSPPSIVDTAAAPLSAADMAGLASRGRADPSAMPGGVGSSAAAAEAAKARRPTDAKDAGAKGQKAITLAKDLELRERVDTYRNFLLFCLSGEEVKQPFGGSITIERDPIEFTRLAQLADILGLGPLDVAGVQSELAETAFRAQAQQVLGGSGSGVVTPEAAARLSQIREKMGLTKEQGDKIVRSVQAERAVGGLADAQRSGAAGGGGGGGGVTLQKLLDMKDAGVDLGVATNAELRLSLWSQEVARALAAGDGRFDAERLLKVLPAELSLPEDKAKRAVEGLVKDKRRLTLVQAVAYLRQRDAAAAAASTNNLLACERAVPSGAALDWQPAAELGALYATWVSKADKGDSFKASEADRAAVRAMFGLSEAEAERAVEEARSGAGGAGGAVQNEEEEALF